MEDASFSTQNGSSSAQSGLPTLRATLPELVERVRSLIVPGERRLLGISGTPGAGKSTLCGALAQALGKEAALVGMDGFHLANRELERLGRRERKGAPDTFDADGYGALLARLRAGLHETIYAPLFDRDLEESIGSAVMVPAGTPLILTEGNYLLFDSEPWRSVRGHLDEAWFLDISDELRIPRLIERHVAHGKAWPAARSWVETVDQRNADAIQASRDRADLIVQWTDSGPDQPG